MEVYLPNKIAGNYDVNSVIYHKDFKKKQIVFIKVDCVKFTGFKSSKTHTCFMGKIIDRKPLK